MRAPEGRVRARAGEHPALVVFLRHVGCPFAEAAFRSLRDQGSAAGVCAIAISHGSPSATERWIAQLGGAGPVHLLIDESRQEYARWGLGLAPVMHLLHPRVPLAAVRLALRGIHNRSASGNRWQMSGTFAIDRSGILRYRHVPRTAEEHPDLGAALAALGRCPAG